MSKKELVGTLMERMQKFGYFPSFTNVKIFIKEYEKLTKPEPQKPVVPQYVADWYEENKDDFEGNLFRCAHNIPSTFDVAKLNEFERWFLNASIKAFQTLVNMHQFGYEVEKEKRYLVKIKGVNEECEFLVFGELSNTWKLRSLGSFGELRKHHTRKELEDAGFGEVFNSPLFEVEEVEE